MGKCQPSHGPIILFFILTGTGTTLVNKWADHQEEYGQNDELHRFNHPFVQTFFMFLGEFLCLWIFYAVYCFMKRKGDGTEDINKFTRGTRKFNPFWMVPPCLCDLMGTSCCFIGLNLTYASSFQMFRGSVIIFTGIFSYIFLGKKLKASEITGMLLVFLGLVIVGCCDFFLTSSTESIDATSVLVGDIIIVIGQVFLALMMVYQQKVYCTRFDVPVLQAVGTEGFFGLLSVTILMTIFYFCYAGEKFGRNPRHVLEDAIDACMQMGENLSILWALFGHSLMTTIYNFCGLTITKEISALTRKVLDSVRTITVWFVAIFAFDQEFQWQTVMGFVILMYGLFLYNGLSVYGSAEKKEHNDE